MRIYRTFYNIFTFTKYLLRFLEDSGYRKKQNFIYLHRVGVSLLINRSSVFGIYKYKVYNDAFFFKDRTIIVIDNSFEEEDEI